MRDKEWKKLCNVANTSTRLVSLPVKYLYGMDINPARTLYAKWIPLKHKLRLLISYKRPIIRTEEYEIKEVKIRSKYPLKEIVSKYLNKGMPFTKLSKQYNATASYIRHLLMRCIPRKLIRNSYQANNPTGWVKLQRMNYSNTRIVSIPACLIQKAGFNPKSQLYGKWNINNKKLILKIKE